MSLVPPPFPSGSSPFIEPTQHPWNNPFLPQGINSFPDSGLHSEPRLHAPRISRRRPPGGMSITRPSAQQPRRNMPNRAASPTPVHQRVLRLHRPSTDRLVLAQCSLSPALALRQSGSRMTASSGVGLRPSLTWRALRGLYRNGVRLGCSRSPNPRTARPGAG